MESSARRQRDQGNTRAYLPASSPWTRVTRGEPRSVLWLRLLPAVLLVVTFPVAFVNPVMVPYANYVLVLLPAMTALSNGPVATGAATAVVLALLSVGGGALGWLPYPPAEWSDLPPVATIGLLCVVLSWVRNRVVVRLLNMTVVAETAQHAILPEIPERVGPVTLSSAYHTAAGSPGLVGGDFLDVQETEFGLRVVVGDVQGHDLGTLRLTEALLGTFRERALDDQDLLSLAGHLERRVARGNRGRDAWTQTFATAALLEITPDAGAVRVVLCGHPAPLLVRERARELSPRPRPPLGLAEFNPEPPEVLEAALAPGDLIMVYTDGLVESRNAAGRTFPLLSLVNAHAGQGAREPETLRAKLRADFIGGRYRRDDDLTSLFIGVPRG